MNSVALLSIRRIFRSPCWPVAARPTRSSVSVSYTHLDVYKRQHFEAESALPLRMGPIGAGTLSFEVRHLLRDPIDATIAALTNCVPPVRFFPLHHRFLAEQEKWFAIAQKLSLIHI